MAGVLQHLRSSTLDKRPNPASMVDGQVAINYASGAPGMFFKDSNGSLVKVGPVHVGSGAPNAVPASGGTAGNSIGEQWLDTSGGTYVFKIWDGSAWRSEAGEFVNVTGDTMTGALGIIAGSAASPSLFISGNSNTGLYSPGADQLAISSNAVQRVKFGTGEVVFNDGGENYDFRIEGDTEPNLVFIDASTNRVGIGTTSPADKLHVNPGAGNSGIIRLDYGDGTAGSGYCQLLTLADRHYLRTVKSGGGVPFAFEVNSVERVRIDTSGRFLVGTSSTSSICTAILQGRSDSTTEAALLRIVKGTTSVADGNGIGTIAFSDSGHVTAATISSNRDGGTWTSGSSQPTRLEFSTTANSASSPTERMRIDSSGRVGIGTTSPGKLLAAEGSTTPGISVKTTSASSYSTNEAINDANDYIQLFANGSTRAAFGSLDTGETALLSSKSVSIMAANANQVIKFATGGSTERLRITSDAYVRLASASGGIQFNGDTAAANALDDYEEGTWTPAYQTSNGDISITSTTVSHAVYTKIGNRVFCTCRFFSNVASGGTGTVRVTGLPFTTASTQADVSCAVSFAARFSTAAPVTATVRSSSTELDLITVYTDATLGGGITYMPAANLRTGVASQNILSISFNYTV